jgi:hypothetical protein
LTAGKKNVAPLEQVAPQGKTRLASIVAGSLTFWKALGLTVPLELVWLLYRQIRRIGAFEDAIHVRCCTSRQIGRVKSVRD